MRDFLTDVQVAAKLGVAREWFITHRRALQNTLGFPLHVEGLGTPRKYDPLAIKIWQDRMLVRCNPHLADGMPGETVPVADALAAGEQEMARFEDELLGRRNRQLATAKH